MTTRSATVGEGITTGRYGDGRGLGAKALTAHRAALAERASARPRRVCPVTPAWWLRAVCGVALLIAGLRLLSVGRRLLLRGRHRCADVIDSFDSLQGTRYVLYLRPFANDVTMAALFFPSRLTQEQALVRRFARFGRVVAIGRPGELLPPVGAVRGQLPLDDWHGPVSRLIAGAHVVLMAAGPGPGTVWEFTEAVRLLEPTRLVLLIYCDAETYDRFRKGRDPFGDAARLRAVPAASASPGVRRRAPRRRRVRPRHRSAQRPGPDAPGTPAPRSA